MNDAIKTPAIIKWAGYLALALLVMLPLSVLTVRSGAWQPGLGLYALACLGSIVLLILFILMLLVPKLAQHRGTIRRQVLFTLPGTLALLSLTLGGGDYPQIHDITTDPADPPLFVTAEQQRGEGANPLTIKADFIAQQKTAYPDLETLQTPLSAQDAFERALAVCGEMGWEVYHQDAAAGIVEAVETTRVMAFKDDVVVRIRATADGSEIDLRSVSRVGRGDIGANAKRIRAFVAGFNSP